MIHSYKFFFHKFIKLSLFSLLFLLACCGGSHVVKISEAEVQSKFSEKVNEPIKLLKIYDTSLSNPTIKLDGVSERLKANFDVKLFNLITGNSTYGKVAVSGVLKYDETKSAVVFTETLVDNVELTDADKNLLSDQNSLLVNSLSKKLGGIFLSGIILRKVEPNELKLGFMRFKPSNIKVADGNLQITLIPSD